jgi:hypothetical protein
MTTLADFSFSNLQIRQYFEGSNEYIPTSELLYVHAHPLVTPNFLAELEALVNQTSQLMSQKNMKGIVVERFVKLAQDLGRQLPSLTKDNAEVVLSTLREVYKMCNAIIGKR